MDDAAVTVETSPDGSLVLKPHGELGAGAAVELSQLVEHAVRHVRPLRLVFDLDDVDGIDPLSRGALAAACHLGDDHHVAVFLDNTPTLVAEQLTAAGVPQHRLRTPA